MSYCSPVTRTDLSLLLPENIGNSSHFFAIWDGLCWFGFVQPFTISTELICWWELLLEIFVESLLSCCLDLLLEIFAESLCACPNWCAIDWVERHVRFFHFCINFIMVCSFWFALVVLALFWFCFMGGCWFPFIFLASFKLSKFDVVFCVPRAKFWDLNSLTIVHHECTGCRWIWMHFERLPAHLRADMLLVCIVQRNHE